MERQNEICYFYPFFFWVSHKALKLAFVRSSWFMCMERLLFGSQIVIDFLPSFYPLLTNCLYSSWWTDLCYTALRNDD